MHALCFLYNCMSYTQVFLHYVWSTKERKPILVKPNRELLFMHIRKNALTKGIHIDRINGYIDHVHCLVCLQPQQTMDQVALLLKGESAYWFNNLSGIDSEKLVWQKDYFVASVSLSIIERVRAYIDRQEIHHQKKTFEQEYNALLKTQLFVQAPDHGKMPDK